MTIIWTPWFNVPLHRRLELFSIAFLSFCGVGLGPFCIILISILLYLGNIYIKTICLLYLLFVYIDRHTGDRGGRGHGSAWLRGLKIWKHCLNYFPMTMVKTVDLTADRNYFICMFPHGLFSLATVINFTTSHSKWSQLFPGIRAKSSTLAINTLLPVSREVWLGLDVCSASANSLTTLMNQSNDPNDASNHDGCTSNAVGLVVGGAKEAAHAYPNTYKCVLKNRKGFVKIAIRTGASLVPAISFGENEILDIIEYTPGPWVQFILDVIKQYTKVAPIPYNGRGILQYNYGLIPKRRPVTTVIGAPIHLEKNAQPSQDDIDTIHQVFCTQLMKLFETHKSKYVENFEKVQLEII